MIIFKSQRGNAEVQRIYYKTIEVDRKQTNKIQKEAEEKNKNMIKIKSTIETTIRISMPQ